MSFDPIESIAIIPNDTDNFDELWCIVDRANGRFVERLSLRNKTESVNSVETLLLENQILMDSTKSYDLTTASASFSGLDHLEGEDVVILADGVVQDGETVVSGAITLDDTASVVHVGLPVNADIETLDYEIQLQDGSLTGVKSKTGNVVFRFVDSRGGFIGPDSDTLYEAFESVRIARFSDALEYNNSDTEPTATSMYTGDIRAPLGANYSLGANVFFRQSDPLPVTITNIIPEIQPGGASG